MFSLGHSTSLPRTPSAVRASASRQHTLLCSPGHCRTLMPSARRAPVMRAQQQQEAEQIGAYSDDEGDTNVAAAYCSIGEAGQKVSRRTLGEMEQDFLLALSSYYHDGKPTLTDDEFELLKEELLWNGSKVAILDSKEQMFMEARLAYQRGKPILSDEAFDELKQSLKTTNSVVTAQGPRCSIRSKKLYSDAVPDYWRMTLLNLPATLLVLGLVFSIDDITGFEITSLIELPPPFGILALWGVLLPVSFVLSTSITNLVLKDSLVLKGPCPNCGTENITYFGDILTVPGNQGPNKLECLSCKSDLTFDSNKRIIVVAATKDEKLKAREEARAAREDQ